MPKTEHRFGTILPGAKDFLGGNKAEFSEIRNQLRKRKIKWFEKIIKLQERK